MWDGAFTFLKVWDNAPGGTIVDRFEKNGVEYVLVEFEKTPGKQYLYIA